MPRNRLDGQRVELKRSFLFFSFDSEVLPKNEKRSNRDTEEGKARRSVAHRIRLARGRFWSCAHVSGSFNQRTRWLIVAA